MARPSASDAPAQKPNDAERSVFPTVAFESTGGGHERGGDERDAEAAAGDEVVGAVAVDLAGDEDADEDDSEDGETDSGDDHGGSGGRGRGHGSAGGGQQVEGLRRCGRPEFLSADRFIDHPACVGSAARTKRLC